MSICHLQFVTTCNQSLKTHLWKLSEADRLGKEEGKEGKEIGKRRKEEEGEARLEVNTVFPSQSPWTEAKLSLLRC